MCVIRCSPNHAVRQLATSIILFNIILTHVHIQKKLQKIGSTSLPGFLPFFLQAGKVKVGSVQALYQLVRGPVSEKKCWQCRSWGGGGGGLCQMLILVVGGVQEYLPRALIKVIIEFIIRQIDFFWIMDSSPNKENSCVKMFPLLIC